jgi:hypothetical protein
MATRVGSGAPSVVSVAAQEAGVDGQGEEQDRPSDAQAAQRPGFDDIQHKSTKTDDQRAGDDL